MWNIKPMPNSATSINSKSLVSQFIDKHNMLVSKVNMEDSSQHQSKFFYSNEFQKRGQGNSNKFFSGGNGGRNKPQFRLPSGLTIRDAKNPLPLTNITNSLFGTIIRIGQEARTYFQSKLTYASYKGMRAPLRSKTRGARVYSNSTLAVKINSKPRDYGLKLVAFI